MKRSRLAALSLLSIPLLAAGALPASAASAASAAASQAKVLKDTAGSIDEPLCQSNKSTCVDAAGNITASTSATMSRRCCSSPAVPVLATT